jgi:hypothetical protein
VQHREDDVERQAGHDRGRHFRVAARRAIDRQDRFVAGPRDEVNFATFAYRPRGLDARLLDHLARDHG